MARDGITPMIGKTGKKSYRTRWSYRDETGKRRFASKVLPTRRQAEKYLRERQVEVQEGRYRAPSKLTVAAYAAQWMQRKEREWTSSTAHLRRTHWRIHLEPHIGSVKLTDLSRYQCQQLVIALERTLAPRSVRAIIGELRALLNGAMHDELIPRNPAARLTLPALDRKEMTTWSAGEVAQFLDDTRTHEDHTAYTVLFTTGVRIGELLALRWEYVDLDGGTIRITDTMRRGTDGTMTPQPGTKTTKDRVIPLTADCVAALREHRAWQHVLRSQAKVWDMRGYVFTRGDGTPVLPSTFARRFGRAVAASELPSITVHGARRTFATILIEQGANIKAVSDLLGHANAQMTMNAYQHVRSEFQASVVNAFGALLKASSATTQGDDGVEADGS